eukprot:1062637_1
MFAWLLLTSISYIICITNSKDPRVVGGSSVPAEDHPYIAAILYNSGSLLCGGSILRKESPAVILTAAHCIDDDMSDKTVRLYASDYNGAYNADTNKYLDVTISRVIVHEDYISASRGDDIALLFITEDISKISRLGTVSIAPLANDDEEPFATNLQVVGYGDDVEDGNPTPTLEAASVPYVRRAACNHDENDVDYDGQITNEMICAGRPGYDSCQGDSGGPLLPMDSNEQIGIVSWGYGCAVYPGVYVNIGVYYDWIQNHLRSQDPTIDPTRDPTRDPTLDPTRDPTTDPIINPTSQPTLYPTLRPTDPTIEPTFHPTLYPTSHPTLYPTLDPTGDPTGPTLDSTTTISPTSDPTTNPSRDPTTNPTITTISTPATSESQCKICEIKNGDCVHCGDEPWCIYDSYCIVMSGECVSVNSKSECYCNHYETDTIEDCTMGIKCTEQTHTGCSNCAPCEDDGVMKGPKGSGPP